MLGFRRLLRFVHIAGGIYLGAFVFSPLIESATAAAAARAVAVGLLMSGAAMWQWKRLAPLLGRLASRDLTGKSS
ncbi:MAG: hypothetical protein ACKOD3_10580 [Phenylobacterium sp.]